MIAIAPSRHRALVLKEVEAMQQKGEVGCGFMGKAVAVIAPEAP
jgi:hypothetical protein